MIDKPNIIYLHSHDTGRWLSPYGFAVATPNLRRLAEQGVLFRNAHCAAPVCSASRAALLTGQSPHRAGMLGLAHRGFRLENPDRLMTHALRRAGYITAIAGLQHVLPYDDPDWPGLLGYDQLLNHPHGGYPQLESVDSAAVDFLKSPPSAPFFLDVGFFETHRHGNALFQANAAGPAGDPRFVQPPAPLPDRPAVRADVADFADSAALLDGRIGRVLDALDASPGMAERTLVICTTDHGPAFPGMKCTLSDAGTGVMLIVRGPGGFAGGLAIDAMVSHLDIFPAIRDLAGLDASGLEGQSLLPLVRRETTEIHDELFGEMTFHVVYEPQRSVRTQRWKYIRRFDDRRSAVAPNVDDGLTKSDLLANGWHRRPRPAEMLFDLILDPTESNNLVTDPAAESALTEMRRRLDEWMRQTADPLLRGPVPLPPKAVTTDANGYSPAGGPWPADIAP
jgi:N-sulfoglucosamine sulfohydrolase